jgi:hypothetical protein
MLRTTPFQPSIALDRNKATRTKQAKGEEEVGKKNLQLSHPSIQTNTYKAPPVYIHDNHRTQVLTTRRWLV